MTRRIVKVFKSFLLFLLLCYVLTNVWNLGNITNTLLFCIFIAIFVPIIKIIDKSSIIVALFGLSYSIIALINGEINDFSTFLLYLIPPFFFFIYGLYLSKILFYNNRLIDFYIITTFLFGLLVYICVISNILETGQIINFRRELIVGNNESIDKTSATLIGLNVSLGFAALPIMFISKFNFIRHICCFIIFLLSLLTTIHMINRTGIIIIVISLIVAFLCKNRWNFWRVSLIGIISIILLYMLLNTNIDIIEAYNERNSDIYSGGGRFEQWMDGLVKLFTDPFGYKIRNRMSLSYVHNLWLDIARVGGIIPFVFVLMITFRTVRMLFKIVKKYHSNGYILVLIFTSLLLSSAVEPVMDGFPIYFYIFLLYCGLLDGIYKIINKL